MGLHYGLMLLVLFFSISIDSTRGQCPAAANCNDCFDWCIFQALYCNEIMIQRLCPGTCQKCPSAECQSLNCPQRCIPPAQNGGNSARCACLAGYELNNDERTCTDINECTVSGVNPCGDGICVNTEGSFWCSTCNEIDYETVWSYYGAREGCCNLNENGICGKSSTNRVPTGNARVIGGEDSVIQRWPWYGLLYFEGIPLCGSSLITPKWVLTAAHCVIFVESSSSLGVLFGAGDIIDGNNTQAQIHIADGVFPHEDYDMFSDSVGPDIALIRLAEEVTINNFVSPVCLPNGERLFEYEICYAVGLGVVSDEVPFPVILQEVDLSIIPDSICETNLVNSSYSSVSHLCAGFLEGGKDTCSGDSGGPLMCQRCDSCDWYLAGITSFGVGCALPGFPGAYTRVTTYQEWIVSKTGQEISLDSACPIPTWEQWGEFGECSVTCGTGVRSRRRVCSTEPGDCGDSSINTVRCVGPQCACQGLENLAGPSICCSLAFDNQLCDIEGAGNENLCALACCQKRNLQPCRDCEDRYLFCTAFTTDECKLTESLRDYCPFTCNTCLSE